MCVLWQKPVLHIAYPNTPNKITDLHIELKLTWNFGNTCTFSGRMNLTSLSCVYGELTTITYFLMLYKILRKITYYVAKKSNLISINKYFFTRKRSVNKWQMTEHKNGCINK